MPLCKNCDGSQSKLNKGGLCKKCYNNKIHKENKNGEIPITFISDISNQNCIEENIGPCNGKNLKIIIKELIQEDTQRQTELVKVIDDQADQISYLKKEMIHKNFVIVSLLEELKSSRSAEIIPSEPPPREYYEASSPIKIKALNENNKENHHANLLINETKSYRIENWIQVPKKKSAEKRINTERGIPIENHFEVLRDLSVEEISNTSENVKNLTYNTANVLPIKQPIVVPGNSSYSDITRSGKKLFHYQIVYK